MDAAERLIGEQGYAATSLRHIIAEAGVNLAAIHYHFGSKEELLDCLVDRRVRPMNEARMAALEKLKDEAEGEPLPVERTLEAFLRPAAKYATPQTVRLMGRLHMEGLIPEIVERYMKPVGKLFVGEIRRALPALPEQEFMWRVEYMIGAMAHGMMRPRVFEGEERTKSADLRVAIERGASQEDIDARVASLVAFLSGGFHAPAATREVQR